MTTKTSVADATNTVPNNVASVLPMSLVLSKTTL